MQLPVHITFRDVPVSDALEAHIREYAARLERFFDRITRCDVTVSHPRRRRTGFTVRVDVTVSGGEIVVGRGEGHAVYTDPYSAVHDAFDRVRRRLEERARVQRGHAGDATVRSDMLWRPSASPLGVNHDEAER